jgi:hypothetical protein
MAAKGKAAKAAGAALAARNNPYLQRLIEDEELRGNLRAAFDSARGAYGRLSNGKGPTKALLEDKKLQRNLNETAAALRDVGTALRQGPRRRRRGGLGRTVLLLLIGGGVAVAASEGLRKKVLDALFGAEEEFDYTSTTSSSPAPEATPAGSSA